jgi:endonuclease/exonuclease/phosphatase family metal-dependent hydrolase
MTRRQAGRFAGTVAWIVILQAAATAAPARAEDRIPSPVDVRIVTYNTHGLPAWIARDRPDWRFPRIGLLFSAYDVVLVQEDFAHHDLLRASVSHDAILRGNDDSGLTTLSRWPLDHVVEIERVPYGSCSGWLLGASDCFADKGFLRVRLALPNGALLDLVNTHLEAGDGDDDHAVRVRQVEILRERLRGPQPAALVLGGDLNLDWNQPHERELLEGLVSDLGLVDSGARPSSPWDRIDYLFVRESDDVELDVIAAGMAEEFVAEGQPLSDHPALFVRLRVTARSP